MTYIVVLIIAAIVGIVIGLIINKYRKVKKDKAKNKKAQEKKGPITKKETQVKNEPDYVKTNAMSEYEKGIYDKLIQIVGSNYYVFPQVNLASVVDKITVAKYRNELFRNVDFGIFDKATSSPLVLIEVNDKTHAQANRYQRDLKVRNILEKANIPLITLYTNYPNETTYIKKRIQEFVKID